VTTIGTDREMFIRRAPNSLIATSS
jgi:hypothetical protein